MSDKVLIPVISCTCMYNCNSNKKNFTVWRHHKTPLSYVPLSTDALQMTKTKNHVTLQEIILARNKVLSEHN